MCNKKADILADDIEAETGRKLTNRQREFARYYVEGIYSNAECARKAGYASASANSIAGHLLAGKKFPHLVEYIQELREERERRYGVTVTGQLKRLHELSAGAEEAGQFSAAINAEKIRSALGGLTVDRREQIHQLDDLSREEIASRLAQLRKQYPQAFIEGEYTEVTDANTGGELLEYIEAEPADRVLSDKD
jgi:phage terminase small subunit